SLIAGLIAAPLLLEWLGQERLGITRVATQWFGYSQLLALGLDGALAVGFARAAASGNRTEILDTLRGRLRSYFAVAVGAAIWILVLYLFAPSVFNVHDPVVVAELRTGLLIAAIGQFTILLSSFKPLAEAEQRGYVVNLAMTVGTVCGTAVSLLLAA